MDECFIALLGTHSEAQRELGPTAYDGVVERTCLYASAQAFVRTNARTIDRLAQRLMERRVMGGDEVHDIVGMPPLEEIGDAPVTTVGGPHE